MKEKLYFKFKNGGIPLDPYFILINQRDQLLHIKNNFSPHNHPKSDTAKYKYKQLLISLSILFVKDTTVHPYKAPKLDVVLMTYMNI